MNADFFPDIPRIMTTIAIVAVVLTGLLAWFIARRLP